MSKKKIHKLSDKQKRLLAFIPKFSRMHGYPPTFREIEVQADFSSPSVVHYNVKILEQLGKIARDHNLSRSLRVIPADIKPNHREAISIQRIEQEVFSIPICGRIVASEPVPIPASDFNYFDAESTVEVPPNMLPIRNPDLSQIYALEVQGNSMVEDLVNDGDIVILQKGQEIRNGDKVAVWLGDEGETTLKRFYKEQDRIRLQPANSTMKPIYISPEQHIEVQGKVLLIISPM